MDGWMDTPQTVMTTRAPAVLKMGHPSGDDENNYVLENLDNY